MAQSKNLQGAAWMLAATGSAVLMTAGVKALGLTFESVQIVLMRCVLGVLLVVPFLYRDRPRFWQTERRGLLLFRGALAAIAINAGFYSLTVLPFSTATVLFFTTPLWVTVLATLTLGETVGIRRWLACLTGFLGAAIVIRPDTGEISLGTLAALLSAAMFAISLIVSKRLSETEPPSIQLFYTLSIAALVASIPGVLAWRAVDITALAILIGATIVGTMRGYFDIRAFAIGDASFVAPFQYTRLIFAIVLGYAWFSEVPDAAALIGGGVIVAATLYIAWRERQLKGAAAGRPSAGI